MWCETFSGDHYDIGMQIGKRYGPWIERVAAFFIDYHEMEISERDMHRHAEYWEDLLKEKAPQLLRQLLGICKGGEIEWQDLLAMNFRFWNALDKQRRQTYPGGFDVKGESGCTNIGMRDPILGSLLGGSLDDIQICWHCGRFYPEEGYKHIALTWVGSAWAARGINERGLAVGSSDLTIGAIPYEPEKRFTDFALKQVLEKAATVREAVALFEEMGPHKGISVMFADAQGDVRLVESCVAGRVEHSMTDSGIFCVNHVKSPVLRQKMEQMGYVHNPSPWSRHRELFLVETFKDGEFARTWENLQTLLSDHGNFPESICHRMAAYVTLAAPQKWPRSLWIANGPCCRRKFEQIRIE